MAFETCAAIWRKIAASADCDRATNLFRQLLCRIHASSIDSFAEEKDLFLKGLRIILAIIWPNGSLVAFSFLEDGQVLVFYVFEDLNMQFARQTLGNLAHCLLSKFAGDVLDQSILANFLEDEHARFEHASLCKFSRTFGYLQTIMEPAASDSGASQQVDEKLKDFETQVELERERDGERKRDQAVLFSKCKLRFKNQNTF